MKLVSQNEPLLYSNGNKAVSDGLQYQLVYCKSYIFDKNKYPDLYDESNNIYYESRKNMVNNDNTEYRIIKDIVFINGNSYHPVLYYTNYLVMIPCANLNQFLEIWEDARIKRLLWEN